MLFKVIFYEDGIEVDFKYLNADSVELAASQVESELFYVILKR